MDIRLNYPLPIEIAAGSCCGAMNTERTNMKKKFLMCVLISVALLGALFAQDSFFDDNVGYLKLCIIYVKIQEFSV